MFPNSFVEGRLLRQVSRGESRAGLDRPTGWNLTISSTFKVELLGEILSFWISGLGILPQIQLAPYSQAVQQLVEDGLLARSCGGINVVLVPPEDCVTRDTRDVPCWRTFFSGRPAVQWGYPSEKAPVVGGSSGGVLAAVERLRDVIPPGAQCVMILADRGERYLDTVYSDDWVCEHLGLASCLGLDQVPGQSFMELAPAT